MIEKLPHLDKADYGIAAGALTSPIWLKFLEEYVAGYMLLGGAFLLTIRILIAIRDWWRGRKP